ncbi:hypothetical protein BGP_6244 [Beggiatoa sp. PS]|nr:hypothetical protein BGP_6244 [Beggiatoa sp. PS]
MIKYLILLIFLSGLTGGGAFWLIQIPDNIQTTADKDTWKLLKIPRPPSPQSLWNKLHRLQPWDEEDIISTNSTNNANGQPIKKAPMKPLELVGIVQQGYNSYILVLEQKNQVKAYHLNNPLPNDTLLYAIYNDFIEVKYVDDIEVIKLYD